MGLRLRNNPELVLREEGKEGAMLFDPEAGQLWLLNPTAAIIYRMLDRWRTRSSLMRSIGKMFDRFGPSEESEVDALIEDYRQIGAVRVSESRRSR